MSEKVEETVRLPVSEPEDRRVMFVVAHDALYRAVCAFSIGDMEGGNRHEALEHLAQVHLLVSNGLRGRELERLRTTVLEKLTPEERAALGYGELSSRGR